mmetsp:Transcript_56813/g.99024  ORF Transcript_56813/g.99024 Transcript_56813/m.99024 type:complete len:189 (+) Transcript_56813:1789-2355(+)
MTSLPSSPRGKKIARHREVRRHALLERLSSSHCYRALAASFIQRCWLERIERMRHSSPVLAEARRNYEDFHELRRGSASIAQVRQSSAGVDGWAASAPETDEAKEKILLGRCSSLQDHPSGGMQKSSAALDAPSEIEGRPRIDKPDVQADVDALRQEVRTNNAQMQRTLELILKELRARPSDVREVIV